MRKAEADMKHARRTIGGWVAALRAMRDEIDELCLTPAGGWVLDSRTETVARLTAAIDHLKLFVPAAVCKKCSGDGCSECHQRGWFDKRYIEFTRATKRGCRARCTP